MIKCPFCGFDNEDGALFCEQCKSDLGGLEAKSAAAAESAIPLAEAMPLAESGPPAAPMETVPLAAPVAPPPAAAVAEAVAAPAAAPPLAEAQPVSPAAPAAPVAPAAPAAAFAPGSTPKLVVIRGLKMNVAYPIYPGENFIGRADEKPVDIDLDDQESPDRVWSSRQHAVIIFEGGTMTIEDLNSANGTFVERERVYPGQKRVLKPGDKIQIGTVQMRVQAE